MLSKIFYATSVQKVLYFLLLRPEQKFYDREISRRAQVGRAAANYSLRALEKAGLISREKKGRMYFYFVSGADPIIRQLKITQNLIYIRPLVQELKPLAIKIILYGSFAAGTNHEESDIDLFVLTRHPADVKTLLYKSRFRQSLQHVVAGPQDFARLKKDNAVFLREISKGMALYEAKA